MDEVDSILIDEARTPLIISGPVEQSENKIYVEVKPLVINLKRKQGAVVRSILQEAKKLLEEDGEGEKTIELLLKVKRGDPKNPAFLDVLANNQTLKKEIDRQENLLSAQKLLPEIDQDLFCVIDERNNSVELTEKGIKLLAGGGRGTSSSRIWTRKATSSGKTRTSPRRKRRRRSGAWRPAMSAPPSCSMPPTSSSRPTGSSRRTSTT